MPGKKQLNRVLVANRGEIAVRVIRACRDLGIETVVVASEADLGALPARCADSVVLIGPAPPTESYLCGERITEVALESGCDALHPGYGFLSQSPEFAEQVVNAGLVFIGPPADAIRLMGDKQAARLAMAKAGVPVVPGFEGTGNETADRFSAEAKKLGFPLLVKATAGGGGRGMRIVREQSELDEAVTGARREAESAFGDGRLFLERFLEGARHIEIQVLADQNGKCIHLGERECSIQRRYQKIIEESPSPVVDEELRETLGNAAVRASVACGYVGAGTVEFLVSEDGSFFFLEMNTRLQVEHPVTELVTGIDIVQWQLRVAAGEALPFTSEEIKGRGHAIECRITAEDPFHGFVPSVGRIELARFPSGPGVRVDTGVESGDEISIHYDSLVAKILVHAEGRDEAVAQMDAALAETCLLGITTNIPYLRAVLSHPVFRQCEATTTFVRDHLPSIPPPDIAVSAEALIAMALEEMSAGPSGGDGVTKKKIPGPFDATDGFRLGGA